MGIADIAMKLGFTNPVPAQEKTYEQERREREEKKRLFHQEYSDEISRLFEEYPQILRWEGTGPGNVNLTIQGPAAVYPKCGRIVLDNQGEILRWEALDKSLEFKRINTSLREEEMISQIRAMLKDDEKASRYCEMIAMSLLDDGNCVFNVPVGMHMQEKEYKGRYSSKKWEKAWIAALAKEFQVKEVVMDTSAGIGCFKMIAL